MTQLPFNNVWGCLLGTAVGDACGARLEGTRRDDLREQYSSAAAVLEEAFARQMHYTDDTQMSLALARYLSSSETVDPDALMQAFADAYESWRGYGRGTRTLIDAYRYGSDWNFLAQTIFPGGSLGNGAAMRSAPIGLRFFGDHELIWKQAGLSAQPTHRHELGVEGAQIIALATSLAIELPEITTESMATAIRPWCRTTVFGKRFDQLATVHHEEQIAALGNGIEAHESVVTALACFCLNPGDYASAIGTAIWQGGDTDTIAAMTGALSGTRLGQSAIPSVALQTLEDKAFVEDVTKLAEALCQARNT